MQPAAGAAAIRATVIVVSRHRPAHLLRCLDALTRQSHPEIELVLVADPASVQTRPDLPMKRVSFDIPNISAARNEGLAQAGGDVVLYVDDDAIAEPRWVERLVASFEDDRVVAATGFTRGPDGLNWQVKAERITPSGSSYQIDVARACLLDTENGAPVSTLGTNCAFRRTALLAVGGFDPLFSFHLDESDVNMRMARRFPGALTAVVPEAEVIHGLAPGASRANVGVPHDLTAIGRSTAIFAARHGGQIDWLRRSQRARLLRHMVAGRIDPMAVEPVMATLEAGIAEAPTDPPAPPAWDRPSPPDFRALGNSPSDWIFLSGWHWQARHLRRKAALSVSEGRHVTILLLTPTMLPHRVKLTEGGWWEQLGGVWGASRPDDSPVIFQGRSARISREWRYYAALRR
ncbi:glycosyltransferase family A protein [Paracoccus sp. MBLB3053]|uniref:Glycosyltransferase family A protein n=1 Tax=Paracoccus aurantius TaxID=3073814 RepID=A0ABU2HQJ5_9RHOB|nr:glycosyltransferase family A protein [Paracoccus sp. MBLB3053]MDS9467042.1 glycosyltransferase family A protein [Paracoccus sp. MBLB3053]